MVAGSPRWGTLALALPILLAAACSQPAAPGEAYFSADGTEGAEPQVDFGKALVGDEVTRVLTLENRGATTLRVVSLSNSEEGTGLGVAPFVLPLSIQPGDEAHLDILFAPTKAGATALDVTFELADATAKQAVLHLAGEAVDPACKVEPAQISFGTIALASDESRAITLSNGSVLPWKVLLGEIDGDQTFQVVESARTFEVAAHESTVIHVRFAAFSVGTFSAALPLSGKAHCAPARIPLTGTAVDHVLTFVPASLDFGAVAIGGKATRSVLFSNAGNLDVDLSGIAVTSQDLGFTVVQTGTVTVPVGGNASIDVELAPTKEAAYSGTLNLLTTDPTRSSISIPVVGTGVQP